jgi:hypothetical protein
MSKTLNTFIVSSADWSIQVDGYDSHSAVISAVIAVFKKFGNKLLMSTTIMSMDEESHMLDRVENADFYATHKIFKELGLVDLSDSFKSINEALIQ